MLKELEFIYSEFSFLWKNNGIFSFFTMAYSPHLLYKEKINFSQRKQWKNCPDFSTFSKVTKLRKWHIRYGQKKGGETMKKLTTNCKNLILN